MIACSLYLIAPITHLGLSTLKTLFPHIYYDVRLGNKHFNESNLWSISRFLIFSLPSNQPSLRSVLYYILILIFFLVEGGLRRVATPRSRPCTSRYARLGEHRVFLHASYFARRACTPRNGRTTWRCLFCNGTGKHRWTWRSFVGTAGPASDWRPFEFLLLLFGLSDVKRWAVCMSEMGKYF